MSIWLMLMASGTALAATETAPSYEAVQRAFLREEFAQVAELAQAFVSAAPADAHAPRVWLWRALSLDRLGQARSALREVDQLKAMLTRDHPLWPELLFWEAEISRNAQDQTRAKQAYQAVVQAAPKSSWAAQAQVGLGRVYVEQQAYEVAIGHFREVALRHPQRHSALEAMLFEGLCQLKLRRPADAAAVLRPLLPRLSDPGMKAQASFALGESLTALGAYQDASAAYQHVLEVGEGTSWYSPALFGLAWASYQLGDCRNTLALLTRDQHRQSAEPHRIEAQFAQGSCELRLGREGVAEPLFKQIVQEHPTHPLASEARLGLVDVWIRRGELRRAELLLHTLMASAHHPILQAQIDLRRATLALEQGEVSDAIQLWQRLQAQSDASVQHAALSGLADAHVVLGHMAEAARDYRAVMEQAPGTVQAEIAQYQLGQLALQDDAWDRAQELFEDLRQHATSEDVADNARLALAMLALLHGDEQQARAELVSMKTAQAHTPLAGRAAYYLATIRLNEDDVAGAQALCEETLRQAPQSEEALQARLLLADVFMQERSLMEASRWLKEVAVSTAVSFRHRARLAKRVGDVARMQQDYASAIAWYDTAQQLLPSLQPEATYWIASCYEEGGDAERAIRWYQAANRGPWHVRGMLAAAKLLERQERLADALSLYESLADEPIPERGFIQERLVVLREETQAQLEVQGSRL